MNCRFCDQPLSHVFIDLINSPASNSFLTAEQLNEPETYYPLKVFACSNCFLVQIDEYKKSDNIFDSGYVYFSSYSSTWLKHAKEYTEMMTNRFQLGSGSQVIEIASNDGYLLQYFKEKNIPVLGVEPTSNTAKVAQEKGIETVVEFFGTKLAQELVKEGVRADVLLGNNVLAHVPDINDFVAGMKLVLSADGVITMEFPHLMQLVNQNQFDTIYHEHFSYLSFTTVRKIFKAQGLDLFDVELLPTHGGSLRIFAKHEGSTAHKISPNVQSLLDTELKEGMSDLEYYSSFGERVMKIKLDFINFLLESRKKGSTVGAYGAAAKGNTLLNYCGVKKDLISFVVDANPSKQNKFLPGSHIPVVSEDEIKKNQPDYIIIFPWNLKDEIMQQLSYIREWNGKFVIPIPHLQVI